MSLIRSIFLHSKRRKCLLDTVIVIALQWHTKKESKVDKSIDEKNDIKAN